MRHKINLLPSRRKGGGRSLIADDRWRWQLYNLVLQSKSDLLKLYSGKSQAQKHFFRSDCQNDKLIALIMHGSLFTKCSCNYVEFDMCTYVMCKNIT